MSILSYAVYDSINSFEQPPSLTQCRGPLVRGQYAGPITQQSGNLSSVQETRGVVPAEILRESNPVQEFECKIEYETPECSINEFTESHTPLMSESFIESLLSQTSLYKTEEPSIDAFKPQILSTTPHIKILEHPTTEYEPSESSQSIDRQQAFINRYYPRAIIYSTTENSSLRSGSEQQASSETISRTLGSQDSYTTGSENNLQNTVSSSSQTSSQGSQSSIQNLASQGVTNSTQDVHQFDEANALFQRAWQSNLDNNQLDRAYSTIERLQITSDDSNPQITTSSSSSSNSNNNNNSGNSCDTCNNINSHSNDTLSSSEVSGNLTQHVTETEAEQLQSSESGISQDIYTQRIQNSAENAFLRQSDPHNVQSLSEHSRNRMWFNYRTRGIPTLRPFEWYMNVQQRITRQYLQRNNLAIITDQL